MKSILRFKKILFLLIAASALVFGTAHAQTTTNPVPLEPGASGLPSDPACLGPDGRPLPGCYALYGGLAEALGERAALDTREGVGGIANSLVALATGAGGVLAVAMLMYEGFLYMRGKGEGNAAGVATTKGRIASTVLGFLLLLSAYAVLRTVNPGLLDLTPRLDAVSVDIPKSADNEIQSEKISKDKSIQNSGAGFNMTGSFTNPSPDPSSLGFSSGIQSLKSGQTIKSITVSVGSGNQTDARIIFHLSGGTYISAPARTGWRGVAEKGQGVSGDNKTPKGDYVIGTAAGDGTLAPVYKAANQNNAVISNGYNYGAAFFGLNIDPSGKNRYIGIHGKSDNQLGTTNGCIRMRNDELVMISPYIHAGIPVSIK